ERALRRRDLEDREPPARPQHPPQLAHAGFEVGDVAHAEADGRDVEAAVLERQRERVAVRPLDRRLLAPRALEHALREVEPRDVGAAAMRLDREVAGAATDVE